jgi:hypothetical protein
LKRSVIVKYLLIIQGIYFLLTALWGLADIESFMDVTGPKTDVWLVKTVSVLILAVAICLLSYLRFGSNLWPAAILGIISAAGLGCIDFYYSLNGVISKVYMIDGFMELLFVIAWIIVMLKMKRKNDEL